MTSRQINDEAAATSERAREPRRLMLSEAEWATRVASEASVDDIDRVTLALAEAGVTSGKPLQKAHTLHVTDLYFSGVKVVRKPGTEDVDESSGVGDKRREKEELPFSFRHKFGPGMTAFATDGTNLVGKSTILGVILWAIRGTVPSPTLQPDVRMTWLREAAVALELDQTTLLIHWRIHEGRPEGGVYAVRVAADADLAALKDAGLLTARNERDLRAASVPRPDGGGDASEDPEAAESVALTWPGELLVSRLLSEGTTQLLTSFESEEQFEAAMDGVLMPRLDLEPIKVWQRLPGAIDSHDAKIIEHGWKSLSQALAIIDPTAGSVLGEIPIITNQLLAVFLGSSWSTPVITARWQLKRAAASVAGLKRRASTDLEARKGTLTQLQNDLAEANAKLTDLGEVPAHLDVVATTQAATRDAIVLANANKEWLEASAAYGTVERELENTLADLHAVMEAAATRKFWHSLRPSCCPRCDKAIEDSQWALEKEGHCSLCGSEFDEHPAVPEGKGLDETSEDPEVDSEDNDEDREDQVVALQNQVAALEAQLVLASRTHDEAIAAHEAAKAAADASVAALEQLDRSAAAERRELVRLIDNLEGRIAERKAMVDASEHPELERQEFIVTVLKAALKLATDERDDENHQVLHTVSDTITKLGIEFGIRNLMSAKLNGAGHLRTIKGRTEHGFSQLAPGERLRLRIALIIGLLDAGRTTGAGRHPGLLIIDDLTSHELDSEDAAAMAKRLTRVPGLQVITASTYAPVLTEAVGESGEIVTPVFGQEVMF